MKDLTTIMTPSIVALVDRLRHGHNAGAWVCFRPEESMVLYEAVDALTDALDEKQDAAKESRRSKASEATQRQRSLFQEPLEMIRARPPTLNKVPHPIARSAIANSGEKQGIFDSLEPPNAADSLAPCARAVREKSGVTRSNGRRSEGNGEEEKDSHCGVRNRTRTPRGHPRGDS